MALLIVDFSWSKTPAAVRGCLVEVGGAKAPSEPEDKEDGGPLFGLQSLPPRPPLPLHSSTLQGSPATIARGPLLLLPTPLPMSTLQLMKPSPSIVPSDIPHDTG